MAHTADLFGFEKPRRPRQRRMSLRDAGSFPNGSNAVHFECGHCGFDEGWTHQIESNAEVKKGRPCPQCN